MRKSNLNKQIFSVLLLSLFCFLFWATSENPSSKESEPVKNSETQEEETKWECNVCKSKFTHNGFELDENGNCKSIEEPMQGFLCSCNCAKEARKKSDEVYNEVLSNDSYKADENCSFESDNDVLMYLIGKSFTQDGGNIKIKFDESGATISGVQYQWMSYTSLGGYKGKVKLSSIDPSNPDGTITLYVSCREKSITDGQIVLFLN
jgi:hypothetical protein